MAYNAGERKDIRRLEKVAHQAAVNDAEVVRGLMSTIIGRAWVHRQLESAHIFAQSFSPDPYITAFREGERNQGLKLIVTIMEHCPDQYILMMREYYARSTASERSRGENANGGDSGPSSPDDDDAPGFNDTSRTAYEYDRTRDN